MILFKDVADAIASIRKSSGDMDMVVLCGAVAHAQLGGVRSISGVPVRMDRSAPVDYCRVQSRGAVSKEEWDRAMAPDEEPNPACPICGATDHEKITTAMGTFVGCPQQSKYSVVMSPQPEKIKVAFAPIAEKAAEVAEETADTVEELARDVWEAGKLKKREGYRSATLAWGIQKVALSDEDRERLSHWEFDGERWLVDGFSTAEVLSRWLNRGQEDWHAVGQQTLTPAQEHWARLAHTRRLRELQDHAQAETRRKEREQVVLDMDWEP